jgi:hypothetical protein
MKISAFVLCFSLVSSLAQAACLKYGQEVEVYGAVDKFHFFHSGNGMHVQSLLIRTDREFCVIEEGLKEAPTYAFQLWIEENGPGSDLKDGDLVKLKGRYTGFGDTIWYSGSPLLEVSSIVKKYETDPAEDALMGR